jgi:hypothetical protein
VKEKCPRAVSPHAADFGSRCTHAAIAATRLLRKRRAISDRNTADRRLNAANFAVRGGAMLTKSTATTRLATHNGNRRWIVVTSNR